MDSHLVRPWHRSAKLIEKQANGDTSHDAERPVEIWGVSCPDHNIQANRYEFGGNFVNRFMPPNVKINRRRTRRPC